MPTIIHIDEMITNIVKQHLSDGYILTSISNPREGSIDLLKKNDQKTIIRICRVSGVRRIDDEHNNKFTYVYGCVIIRVEEHDASRLPRGCMSLIRTLNEYVFYPILQEDSYIAKDKMYYASSADEYISIVKLRNDRKLRNSSVKDEGVTIDVNKVPTSLREKIVNRIRENKGMKRAKYNVVKNIHLFNNGCQMECCIRWNDDERHGTLHYT